MKLKRLILASLGLVACAVGVAVLRRRRRPARPAVHVAAAPAPSAPIAVEPAQPVVEPPLPPPPPAGLTIVAPLSSSPVPVAILAKPAPAVVEPPPPPPPTVVAPVSPPSTPPPPAAKGKHRGAYGIRRLLLVALVVGVAGAIAGIGTYSAFTSTTSNTGDSFASGTVTISDNDAGAALLSLTNSKPGDTSTGCIKVTYTGSLNAAVRMYATVTGSLAQYLTLTVTRGTNTSAYPSCAAFSADATDYIGSGAGVVYNGNLSAFPATWGAGLVDPTSWNQNDAHSYKFVVTVQDNNAAQGLSSTASFTWEARNN